MDGWLTVAGFGACSRKVVYGIAKKAKVFPAFSTLPGLSFRTYNLQSFLCSALSVGRIALPITYNVKSTTTLVFSIHPEKYFALR